MFPIRDHNPSGRTPYVTWTLIAANVAIFLGYWLTMRSDTHLTWFFMQWGLVPARIANGEGLMTFVTSMFLHGGWMHLAGNMLFLWIFGDNLEDGMGHRGFLAFYLACGVAAGLLQYAAGPGSTAPMIGASGAIAGVMGGYLLLFPKAKVDVLIIIVIFFRVLTIPAWVVLAVWFGLQTFSGFGDQAGADGVAYWAHVGGFISGLVLALPLWLRRGGTGYWAANRGEPPHPDAVYSRSSVPVVRRRR